MKFLIVVIGLIIFGVNINANAQPTIKAVPKPTVITKIVSHTPSTSVHAAGLHSAVVSNPPSVPQPAPQLSSGAIASAPVTYASGCSSYQTTIAQYAWSVQIALAICQAESGGNPYAVSATNDFGLFQLHNQEIFNPYSNISAAYRIYEEQGWGAWTTFNDNAYVQYL